MKQLLRKYWDEMSRIVDRRISKEEVAVATPWTHLNNLLGGGYWSGLHPIVSSPGNGKTTFAVQLAAYAASQGVETYYANLELDETQMVLRLASALDPRISWSGLYKGEEEGRELLDSLYWDRVKDLPLTLDTGSAEGWSIQDLQYWLDETDASSTRFVVIDYLQLANLTDTGESRNRITLLTKQLQDIGRHNNAAILAISSTSRSNYDDRRLVDESEPVGHNQRNYGWLGNRASVLKAAKESGDVEYGATTLASIVRYGQRTFLLMAKRRLDGGAVWCSFVFDRGGFREDDTFASTGQDYTEDDDLQPDVADLDWFDEEPLTEGEP